MKQSNGIALTTLHEVVLSDLGRQAALSHGINTAPVPQLAGSREWSPARWTRRIDVHLSTQWLTAYEDNLVVYRAPIATGRDGFTTPTGSFAIYDKLRLQTMIGADGGESWYVPDVPWFNMLLKAWHCTARIGMISLVRAFGAHMAVSIWEWTMPNGCIAGLRSAQR